MANIKSQKKRILTNEKRHERNKAVKAEVKTRTKRANETIGTDDNADAVRLAMKRIDSAAVEGHHPQERRGPQEEPPHEEGQRRRLTLRAPKMPGFGR